MEFSGSPEELALRACEWFEWLLTLPIERWEWLDDGELVFREWFFPPTGETLYHLSYSGRPCPARPRDRVVLIRGSRN